MKFIPLYKRILAVALLVLAGNTMYALDLQGTGSTADPYLIQSEADLVALSAEGTPSDWKTYKLTTDLNMAGKPFYGLGAGANGSGDFKGGFDGDNHVILNLTITPRDVNYHIGFVNNLKGGSSVKNLGIVNIKIDAPDKENVGGIVGFLSHKDRGLVENCFVDGGTITCRINGGGIVGSAAQGTIRNCYSDVQLNSIEQTRMGGITSIIDDWADFETTIENVMVYGDIAAPGSTDLVHAIVGIDDNAPETSNISNAYYSEATCSHEDTTAIAIALEDLALQASYPGFDFDTDSIWKIQDGRAVLQFMPAPYPPSADAGDDLYVREGDQVTISGTDSDFGLLSTWLAYIWETGAGYPNIDFNYRHVQEEYEVHGIPFSIDSLFTDSVSFTVPDFTKDTALMIILRAYDLADTSDADTLMMYVRTAEGNSAPVADAGEDIAVQYGRELTLEASGSDIDNDGIRYSWTVPEPIIIEDTTARVISFIAPYTLQDSILNFTLNTYDDSFNAQSADDVVAVTVLANVKPVCTASAVSTTVQGTELVALQATEVSDANGDELTLHWGAPEGITISDTLIYEPRFTAPNVSETTDYDITLYVSDGFLTSELSTVTITVEPLGSAYPPNSITALNGSTVSVFPNPTNGVLTIEVPQNADISVINMLGTTAHSQRIEMGANTVDLSKLPKGIYLLHVVDSDQEMTLKVQVQ